MGQLFAPRAFGSKKCVVRAFVARPDTHSFIHSFIHVFLSRPFITGGCSEGLGVF